MLRRSIVSAAVLAALAGCATKAPFLHTRPGVTEAQLFADSDECTVIAKGGGTEAARQAAGVAGAHNPALQSQAGAALGAGIAEGIAQARAQATGYEACMASRGYLQTTLTEEELKRFRAFKGVEDRKRWVAEFAARDHGDRAVAAKTPPARECKPNALRRCAQ